jgi:hypothetical protein
MYDYRRIMVATFDFAAKAGKEQRGWDFNTCVRNKESCRVYHDMIRMEMDEVGDIRSHCIECTCLRVVRVCV